MGLTIHYSLTSDRTDLESIRSLVQGIRHLAMQLPFQEIGDIIEFKDHECDHNRDDPWRWLYVVK
jgi:hypothetical protein